MLQSNTSIWFAFEPQCTLHRYSSNAFWDSPFRQTRPLKKLNFPQLILWVFSDSFYYCYYDSVIALGVPSLKITFSTFYPLIRYIIWSKKDAVLDQFNVLFDVMRKKFLRFYSVGCSLFSGIVDAQRNELQHCLNNMFSVVFQQNELAFIPWFHHLQPLGLQPTDKATCCWRSNKYNKFFSKNSHQNRVKFPG